MANEMQTKFARALALVVAASGILISLGWIFDVDLLKSLSPSGNSMKFNTAVSFVLSGAVLYFIGQTRRGDFDSAQVVLPIASLAILLLMGTQLFSFLFGIRTGVEEMFISDSIPSTMTATPGSASFPTVFNFIVIAIAALRTFLRPEKLTVMLKITGGVIGAIGILAILGYLMNMPLLYYFVANINTAMAFYTAVLFVFLGVGFLCV